MESPGPHFQIIWLMNDAALFGPESVKRQDQILEGHNLPMRVVLRATSLAQEEASEAGCLS
jgi:hypothetical protein